MRRLIVLLGLLALLMLVSVPALAQNPGESVHVVQPGENLFRISLRYGVSISAVASRNGISNVNLIFVGQRLIIPVGGTTPPVVPTANPGSPTATPAPAGGTYTVQRGDTLGRIATRFNTTVQAIASLNGIANPNRIFAGQVLKIPGGGTTPTQPTPVVPVSTPGVPVVSGTNYTQMLAAAYAAIKRVNSNILVISGAPAPTGFFGGRCANEGCDDDIFIRQMAQAGAGNVMDCVGVHYNEGIVPPNQTSGDPRGNSSHYSRYYQGMFNLYASVFPGKSLCFTEIGYLSPEGYGPLPAAFSWAANTTAQQQAVWLSQAAQLAKNSGRVRLFIVWNVDSTNYGADPQAGFAIIRPNNTCNACVTLGTVMGVK